MKYCSKCGNELHDEATVCIHCGREVPVERKEEAEARRFGPAIILNTNRSLLKYILLSILTFGIYGIVVMTVLTNDVNVLASRYDGKKTMHFCLMTFVFSWLTMGIYPLIWYHKISERIGDELQRRHIYYNFGAGTFWGWNILGSLIIVGPFIYLHKLFKAVNMLCEDYNVRG